MGTIPEQKLVLSADERKVDVQDGMNKQIDRSRDGPIPEEVAAAIEWAHLGGD